MLLTISVGDSIGHSGFFRCWHTSAWGRKPGPSRNVFTPGHVFKNPVSICRICGLFWE